MAAPYIDYRPGTLNVIMCVPHGGKAKPTEIPDRAPSATHNYKYWCIEPDTRTFEASEMLREHIHSITGKYPYFIASTLDRAKLDPNRDIGEATFGNPHAVAHYEYYHGMVEVAKKELQNSKEYRGALVLDIHGQSHPHNLTELGYGLPAAQIDSDSYSLKNEGTLKCAAKYIGGSGTDKDLLTGKLSLGHFMQLNSVNCLPSPANSKIQNRYYFNGGYTIRNHCSEWADSVQIELSKEVRSSNSTALNENMRKIAQGICSFCKQHYDSKA